MRNRDLIVELAKLGDPGLDLDRVRVVPRYVLYSRTGPTILIDPTYAYWAISHGQASWVTTLLNIKRGVCLESIDAAVKCVREAYERLMDLELGTYVFRDYQSASTLSSIICWDLRGNKPLYARCRKLIIGLGLKWGSEMF